jgi:hypothetical protein
MSSVPASPSRWGLGPAGAVLCLVLAGTGGASQGRSMPSADPPPPVAGCRVPSAVPSGPSFAVLPADPMHEFATTRFLTGCSPGCFDPGRGPCERSPLLHVPSSAHGYHLHGGLADEHPESYLRDQCRPDGRDGDARWGAENPTVLLFAGHGTATAIFEERLRLEELRLGDGNARYLFLLSCSGMAHGPNPCGPTLPTRAPYGCPELFTPGQKLPHRNALQAWRNRIAPGLRLVCGGSTPLVAEPVPGRFWQNHLLHRLPVADAFIDSLAEGLQVGLCVSRGGTDPSSTPLFDRDFREIPNPTPVGEPHLYAMYSVRGTPAAEQAAAQLLALTASAASDLGEPPPRDWLPPILAVAPTAIPHSLLADAQQALGANLEAAPLGFVPVSPGLVFGAGPAPPALSNLALRVHPRSGAVEASWQTPTQPGAELPLDLDSLRTLGTALYGSNGTPSAGGVPLRHRRPDAYTLRIDRMPEAALAEPTPDQLRCHTTCTVARIAPTVQVTSHQDGHTHAVEIHGEGAEWRLRLCPPGQGTGGGIPPLCTPAGGGTGTATLTIIERQMTVVPAEDPAYAMPRRFAEAATIASQRLAQSTSTGVPTTFELADHRFLYLSAPVHCAQTRMVPLHRFTFTRQVPGPEQHAEVVDVPVYGDASPSADWDCGGPS